MLGSTYGPASDFEIVWTIIASVGLIFAMINLRAVISDWKFIKAAKIRNGRSIVAPLAVFTEFKRMFLQIVFLTAGVVALKTPDGSMQHLSDVDMVLREFVRWGFMISASLTCAATVYAWRVRRILMEHD